MAKKVGRIEIIKLGPKDVARWTGNEVVIERYDLKPCEPLPSREIDVTDECSVELRESKSSGGHYVGILHGDLLLFALGVDDKSKVIPLRESRGYRLEHVQGAVVSFRVTKRT